MTGAEDILRRLKETRMNGPLVIPLPKIFKGSCLNCGWTTNNIMNYLAQNDGFGLIVAGCIKKNIKNVPFSRYPITVCSERCLLREIEAAVYCIIEEITK